MILIALGANLPAADGASPLVTCLAAAESLRSLPGLRLARLSRWYATAPVPASDQPDYVNGVALLEGTADPAGLLSWLHAIEHRAGRVRGETNAARVLDLDILAIGDMVRTTPDPVVPHPRLHARAFVLLPLVDVAPRWRHPVSGLDVGAMLAALPPQPVCAL